MVALGNYDGVHLGHQTILNELKIGFPNLPVLLYTFDPHPVKKLVPSVAPLLINTLAQKLELLSQLGLAAVVVEKFTTAFSKLSPEIFFKKILINRLHAKCIAVGYDFTFGAKRRGNVETLEQLCFQFDVDCRIIKPVLWKNTLVSSTLVRKHLSEGQVSQAALMLGRPYFLDGCILHGTHRGKKLTVPTANIETENELLPKNGTYITNTKIDGKILRSVTNIGCNPTFGYRNLSIETHILDYQKNIYGKKIRIYFLKRIRDERKFSNPLALKKRILTDIEMAHATKE